MLAFIPTDLYGMVYALGSRNPCSVCMDALVVAVCVHLAACLCLTQGAVQGQGRDAEAGGDGQTMELSSVSQDNALQSPLRRSVGHVL